MQAASPETVPDARNSARAAPAVSRRILHGPHSGVTPGAGLRRPLSSYTSDEEEPQEFQPSIVVPHLRWSEICLRIGSGHSNRLTAILEAIGRLPGEATKVIGIAGDSVGVGCTTLILALARQAARLGRRVALLEANASTPGFQVLFGLQISDGLSEVIAAQIPLPQATVYAHDERVAVIAWGNQAAIPLGGRQRLQLSLTASRLRFAYNLVLVDLGSPTHDNRHAIDAFAALHGDATLIVSDHDRETRRGSELQNLLETIGRPILGIIENAAPNPLSA